MNFAQNFVTPRKYILENGSRKYEKLIIEPKNFKPKMNINMFSHQ